MSNPWRERVEVGDAVLYLGDCRESPRRLKETVGCRKCDWVWRPVGVGTRQPCPQCGAVRDVRNRNGTKKPDLTELKRWRAERPGYSTEWERRYRRRALMLVGRGETRCVRCGCDRKELLEINHKDGGGGKELKGTGHKFYRDIASLRRSVADLELLCKPCNAVHALELRFGSLPFRVIWDGADEN